MDLKKLRVTKSIRPEWEFVDKEGSLCLQYTYTHNNWSNAEEILIPLSRAKKLKKFLNDYL